MKQSKLLIASLLSVVSIASAYAKEGDLQQELKVAAVSQKADIKNNQVIFYGPVNVTQGSININADELRAFGTESGTQKTMVATGNPATFSQELDDGRIGTASADEIKYELATSILTLTGNAKLDQAGSQVTGNLISYNIEKQQLIAESTGTGEDRVITIFQPESHPDLIDSEKKKDEQPHLPDSAKPGDDTPPAIIENNNLSAVEAVNSTETPEVTESLNAEAQATLSAPAAEQND
ncbi:MULTISPECIES: lipopolysaccharide transport periplasmic protein LptA [unclassified Shewanella]|uniref:lipopolysaccharide transport periplasmic protein LptA n=1 Tax=unclassified Shewanella TaxID=196818 RepID=UPI000C83AA38|nr:MULTISPECIES: lipopolysaccharide transport periplasmic protein LptA [unclassified Shewanella]MDO6619376.1 lipopolysaccharide transport periplasmic protein LptA [Shewanella sp. 6_MG-2023]MDO6679746.1 lipopolysaccharide transport periplasmic protein LptA [Shewanella sp. 4_MG-2023]MDO6776699.1 lipopolysaccharide transport periplasmic protein LptA [Shewanella sp. 3_MG-2023]PMG30627.1 lipopolysaccharide transport periplasmic protein LptA [Shewanella sp. 10N.286.52.C2]PMH85118.1 lipopolysaccharid